MKRKYFVIVLLMAAAGVAGVAARAGVNYLSERGTRSGYTVVWQVTNYDENGEAVPYRTETRYVSANGNWRAVERYADGRTEEMFAEVGRGVFLARGDKMHFLSDYPEVPAVSDRRLRNSRDYLRTETVLGLTAHVSKVGNADAPPDWMEFYRAPALGGDYIKVVERDPQTHRLVHVTEPISITPGEPAPAQVRGPEGLPVDFTNYEKLHGAKNQ